LANRGRSDFLACAFLFAFFDKSEVAYDVRVNAVVSSNPRIARCPISRMADQ
jgi:hypothetical protein